MSIPAFAWAIEEGVKRNLPTSARMLLVYLADKANGALVTWPCQETIAEYTGLKLRSVRSMTQLLANERLIRIEPQGKSRCYHILRPANGLDHEAAEHRQILPVKENIPTETPANFAGETTNTGKICTQHRQNLPKTPAKFAAKPYLREPEVSKPKTREREAAGFLDSGGVGRKSDAAPASQPHADPNAADPLDRPVDPAALAGLVSDLARGMFSNYPPRVSGFSRAEQIEAMAEKPRYVSKPVAPEHLAAIRRIAMIPVGASP